jgi:pyruvate/2-oxoglutarate dehydrogenase complex dihydrolipoamide acyltransferase (E2) component
MMAAMSSSTETRIDVVMPDVGLPEMNVTVWFFQPGDHVYQGDRLVEVGAHGATFDVPAPVTGRLVDRQVFPHDVVRPGQVLGAVIADSE